MIKINNELIHIQRRIEKWLKDKILRRIIKNSGWLISGNSFAACFSLLSIMIMTRSLGPKLYGLYAVVIAYLTTIERFVSFQSWEALIKYGAEALENKDNQWFIDIIKTCIFLDIIGAILGLLVAIIGINVIVHWRGYSKELINIVSVCSLIILFELISSTPKAILRLLNNFKILAWQRALYATLILFGNIAVFFFNWGLKGFLLVWLFSIAISDIFLIIMAYQILLKRGYLTNLKSLIKDRKKIVTFSIWCYVISTLDIPVKQLDIIITSAVVSLEAAGIYKIIKEIMQMLSMIGDPISHAVYPEFALMIAENETINAIKYVAKIGIIVIFILGVIVFPIAISSRWWLGLLFGEAFASGWLALVIFSFFKVFAVASVPIHPLFIAMGYLKQTVIILLFANTTYLALAFYLGSRTGLIGLAIAFGIQLLFVVIGKISYVLYSRPTFINSPGKEVSSFCQ